MLILARHGNTFESHETPVMVGAKTDLPLTAQGLEQARRAAAWLQRDQYIPDMIVAGPLKRTQQFAVIVAQSAHLPVITDNRLREIDYGAWEGLSSDQIRQRGDANLLHAWEEKGVWPSAVWPESESDVRHRLQSFLADYSVTASSKNVFVCTSNGILRLMRSIMERQAASRDFKVAPGNVCLASRSGETWTVTAWNSRPE